MEYLVENNYDLIFLRLVLIPTYLIGGSKKRKLSEQYNTTSDFEFVGCRYIGLSW